MQIVFGNPFFACFAGVYYLLTVAVNILAPSGGGGVGEGGLESIQISPAKQDASSPSPIVSSSVVALSGASFFIDHSQTYPLLLELPSGLFPATVITVNGDFSARDVQDKIEHFEATDDVFDQQFLNFIILVGNRKTTKDLPSSLVEYLLSLGAARLGLVHHDLAEGIDILDGPYVASALALHPVWKLLPDRQGAFVASVIQTKLGEIKYLNASTAEASPNLAVAVPSRLYYPAKSDKPLNGLRVAIKDNIDIAGVKTFASSRAYGELYGIASTSALAIQKLLDLGAVIVGKTGMSQFADAGDPTSDFIDFHAPWNPRGDGLRSPGGSSFGAGAATGAYDWLDFAVGTDTGGSVRVPAASQSVFGFRPSRGAASSEGTVVIHDDLDMIGILSRDFDILQSVSDSLFNISHDSPPSAKPTLIYPSHLFPAGDRAAEAIYEKVVSSLEKLLQLERRVVNFTEEWSRAQAFTIESFKDYFAPVFYEYITWGQYHGRAAFRSEYKAKFGRQPYVNPVAQMRWEEGTKMTHSQFQSAQSKREQFQVFIESIFGPNSLMVTPFKYGEPEARDIYRPSPRQRDREEFGWGLQPEFQSPMAGQPEVVFTVAQLPVLSTVSQVEEKYGVVASIIGSKGEDTETPLSRSVPLTSAGTDTKLLEITGRLLTEMKVPRVVLTGRVPFEN